MEIRIKSKTVAAEELNQKLKVSQSKLKGRRVIVGDDKFYYNDILNGIHKEVFNKKANLTQDDCDSLHEIMDQLDSIKNEGHTNSGWKQKLYNVTRRWIPNRGRTAKINAIRNKLNKDFPSSQQLEDQKNAEMEKEKAAQDAWIAKKQEKIDTFLKQTNDYSDIHAMPEGTEKEIESKAQAVRTCIFDESHKVQGLINVHQLNPAKYDEYREIISKSVEDLSKLVESLSFDVRKKYLDEIEDFPMLQISEVGILLEFRPESYYPSNIRPELLGIIYQCFLSEKTQERTLNLLGLDQFKIAAKDFQDHHIDRQFETEGTIKDTRTGEPINPRFYLYSLFLISQTMTQAERTEKFGELEFQASGVAWGTLHIGDLWVPLQAP